MAYNTRQRLHIIYLLHHRQTRPKSPESQYRFVFYNHSVVSLSQCGAVMGFRFNRRVRLGGGWSLSNTGNIGFSNKLGTISTSGLTFRTGITGLSYRVPFSGRKSGSGIIMVYFLLHILALQVALWVCVKLIQVAILLAPILWQCLCWVALTGYDLAKYGAEQYRLRKQGS